jgi:hypothetical protein
VDTASGWTQPAGGHSQRVDTASGWPQPAGGHSQRVDTASGWTQPAGGHSQRVDTASGWLRAASPQGPTGAPRYLVIQILPRASLPCHCKDEVHHNHVVRLGGDLNFRVPFAVYRPKHGEEKPVLPGSAGVSSVQEGVESRVIRPYMVILNRVRARGRGAGGCLATAKMIPSHVYVDMITTYMDMLGHIMEAAWRRRRCIRAHH